MAKDEKKDEENEFVGFPAGSVILSDCKFEFTKEEIEEALRRCRETREKLLAKFGGKLRIVKYKVAGRGVR